MKLSITAVSYLNTKPLLYGILESPLAEQIDLKLDIPSECARKLASGEADLGLVPVAVIPELENPRIISDFCIGTEGAVRTVAIFSEQPLEHLDRIYLDFHSRTSVELTSILVREFWKLDIELLPAPANYFDLIGGNTGGLVIGDRTIGLEERFPYMYDLGQAWKSYTGLPFVFAAWVTTKELDQAFLSAFNAALANGIRKIPHLNYLLISPHPRFDVQEYLTRNISFHLDAAKREALERFLAYLTPERPVGMAAAKGLNPG